MTMITRKQMSRGKMCEQFDLGSLSMWMVLKAKERLSLQSVFVPSSRTKC